MSNDKRITNFSWMGVLIMAFMSSCFSAGYDKTVEQLDFDRFMGDWYVIASRPTFLEKGAYNAIEKYNFNPETKEIEVAFTFRKDSFDGPEKSIPQTGYLTDEPGKWKVSPFWPLKFSYLILKVGDNYDWTAVGVPNQSYLWIMARDWQMSDEKLGNILNSLKENGYSIENVERVPQKHD